MPLLAACAAAPFDTAEIDTDITPAAAAVEPRVHEGTTVLWGGTIVEVRNQPEQTVLEVVSYPLGRDQRPDADAGAGHRFLAIRPGYLEPADYAPGRALTVKGRLDGVRSASVGDHEYVYPVVRADGVRLWRPQDARGGMTPRFSIGIGVILN